MVKTLIAIVASLMISTHVFAGAFSGTYKTCLLYTSDAADEGLGVDLGGRRII